MGPRPCILSKALKGTNSPTDYAAMASGINITKSYSYDHAPYHCGSRNLLKEYTELLKKKGVKVV